MSLISPEDPARAPARPGPADLRRALVADRSRQGPPRLRRRAPPGRRVRGPGQRPRGTRRAGPPSPPRPCPRSSPAWRHSASATSTRSSPTTMRAAPSRRACGGCSTTSATPASACSTAASRRGSPRAASSRARSGCPGNRRHLALRDGVDAGHRPRGSRRTRSGSRRAHRRAGAGAVSRRHRARGRRCPATSRRRSAGPTAGNLGPDGRFLRSGGAPGAVRRPGR